MAKTQVFMSLDGGTINQDIGTMLPQLNRDYRTVSARGTKFGLLDLRGAKITKEFFEGSRFASVNIDDTTEVYNDEGEKLNVRVRAVQGYFGKGARKKLLPEPYDKVLAFDEF